MFKKILENIKQWTGYGIYSYAPLKRYNIDQKLESDFIWIHTRHIWKESRWSKQNDQAGAFHWNNIAKSEAYVWTVDDPELDDPGTDVKKVQMAVIINNLHMINSWGDYYWVWKVTFLNREIHYYFIGPNINPYPIKF